MKVKELTETPLPTIDDPREIAQFHDLHRYKSNGRVERHGYKQIGHGVEAVVVNDKEGPGVIKVLGNNQEIRRNAYMQYILMSRRYANENPYLPRVESIQKFSDPNMEAWIPHNYFVIKLEKLTPLYDITGEESTFIYNTVFGKQKDSISPVELATALYWGFENVKGEAAIVDKRLLAVKNLIYKISDATDANIDIHHNNIMARRTAYGTQLVVIDPLIY